jgi:hypothetical protein
MEVKNLHSDRLSPFGVKGVDFIGITEEYERSLELFEYM